MDFCDVYWLANFTVIAVVEHFYAFSANMELEVWINSRLRFCLCIVLFSLLTEEFLVCSIIFLADQLLSCSRRSYSWKCHSPLSGSSAFFFFYHSHRFLQRLASVFTPHHSPLTIKTPWEQFQRLLILLVRFIVPCFCLWSLFQRDTRPSTQDVPPHDPGTAEPVPVPLHSVGKVSIRVATKTKFCNLIG